MYMNPSKHSPPFLGFPEPLAMALAVDGVIVAAEGRTNRKALGIAVNTLKRLRANVVGVLNEMRADSCDGDYFYHCHPKYNEHYSNEALGG
jgi:Mrp family chromosome partitioning ATPase